MKLLIDPIWEGDDVAGLKIIAGSDRESREFCKRIPTELQNGTALFMIDECTMILEGYDRRGERICFHYTPKSEYLICFEVFLLTNKIIAEGFRNPESGFKISLPGISA